MRRKIAGIMRGSETIAIVTGISHDTSGIDMAKNAKNYKIG